MKWFIACFLICASSFSNTLSVNIYNATTAQSPVKQGAKQVTFFTSGISGFTGTILNSTLTAATMTGVQVLALHDGGRLNDIPYSVSSGNLVIIEVR